MTVRQDQVQAIKKHAVRLSEELQRAGFNVEANQVIGMAHSVENHDSLMAHLKTIPLTEALWWFIENITEDHPRRGEFFFALRERVRVGK